VALLVEFVPYSEMIRRITDLTPEGMNPPNFEEEERAGNLDSLLAPRDSSNPLAGIGEFVPKELNKRALGALDKTPIPPTGEERMKLPYAG
jgi:hypothetical protein